MNAADHRADSPDAVDVPGLLFDLVDSELAGYTDAEIDQRLNNTLQSLGYDPPVEASQTPVGEGVSAPLTEPATASIKDAERFWALTDEFVTGRGDDIWQEASTYIVKSSATELSQRDPAVQRIYDQAHRDAQQIVVDAYVEAQRILADADAGAQQKLLEAYQCARRITEDARVRQRCNGSDSYPVREWWAS